MTLIGQRLRESPEILVVMAALCSVILLLDLSNWYEYRQACRTLKDLNARYTKGRFSSYEEHLAAWQRCDRAWKCANDLWPSNVLGQWSGAIVLVIVYPVIAKGNLTALGLRLAPSEGWRYWVVATFVVTALVAVLVIPVGALWWSFGGRLGDVAENHAVPFNVLDFIRAPFAEEIVYRMGICTIMAAWIGPRTTIAASGILFAIAHIAAGVENPVNLIAGFVLAWSFLKSNTIIVPMALHGLGNMLGHVIIWKWVIPLA